MQTEYLERMGNMIKQLPNIGQQIRRRGSWRKIEIKQAKEAPTDAKVDGSKKLDMKVVNQITNHSRNSENTAELLSEQSPFYRKSTAKFSMLMSSEKLREANLDAKEAKDWQVSKDPKARKETKLGKI